MVIMDDDNSSVLYTPPSEKLNRQMPESAIKQPFSFYPNAMVQCNHHQHKNREIFLENCLLALTHSHVRSRGSHALHVDHPPHHKVLLSILIISNITSLCGPCQRPLIIKHNQAAKPFATAFFSALTYATQ